MNLTRQQLKYILMAVDTVIILFSSVLSMLLLQYYIRFDAAFIFTSQLSFIIFYLISGNYYRTFSKINRYTTIRDLFDINKATGLSTLLGFIVTGLLFDTYSLRYALLMLVFTSQFISIVRMAWRLYNERERKLSHRIPETEERILVVGAGEGGHLFINRMQEQRNDVDIFGVVDDDETKEDTYLSGVPILGTTKDIPRIIRENRVDEIVVAIPTMTPEKFEEILDIGNALNVPVKKMPLLEDVMLGKLQVSSYVDVDISDLLGREEVQLDTSEVDKYIAGKTILVTGAGGSIGSEIVRQISRFRPARVLLLGHGENSIYQINGEMNQYDYTQTTFVPIIADIQDEKRMHEVMAEHRPDYVFHAAAHKHVPMMEYNPTEAVKNNIYGTLNVARAAKAYDVEKFIMVSTDKANNPTNVMGATKRVAEMIVTGMNEDNCTSFAAVRFGNVLGSRGSVIPLFKKQIKGGGPVTVTDFRMTRYFMTIPEASRLVIQAGVYAKGGELFVLDMGEPVRIYDLAEKLIKLSGHSLDEIEIVENGIRPGEKLYEELLLEDETTGEKIFDKIFVGKVNNDSMEDIASFVRSLDLTGKSNGELAEKLLEYVKQ